MTEGTIVVIVSNGHLVQRVDPETRQCAGEAQQFRMAADGALKIVPKWQWVAEPTVLEVGGTVYR
jgi:hypothetical protein